MVAKRLVKGKGTCTGNPVQIPRYCADRRLPPDCHLVLLDAKAKVRGGTHQPGMNAPEVGYEPQHQERKHGNHPPIPKMEVKSRMLKHLFKYFFFRQPALFSEPQSRTALKQQPSKKEAY
jgi:hypothetical protein